VKPLKGDDWERSRARAVDRLIKDLKEGKVDSDIAEWLYAFNLKHKDVYTISSCSGRVVVFYGKNLFSKREAKSLCECHYPERCRRYLCPTTLELSSLVKNVKDIISWVSLQPPIIHFAVKNFELAEKVLECAIKSGFAHSGFRRYRNQGYIVEVRAYDKLHLVLPADCDKVLLFCEILKKYKKRLSRFLECINNRLQGY
jgi:tRNA(Phe) wybutosine-synthesizing methylase Tyw3